MKMDSFLFWVIEPRYSSVGRVRNFLQESTTQIVGSTERPCSGFGWGKYFWEESGLEESNGYSVGLMRSI